MWNNINLIVAVGKSTEKTLFPIGKNGNIPWHCKEDMKWFRECTMGHPVIMGRKTYESIGKPLDGRTNIVVTSKTIDDENVIVCHTVEDAISKARSVSDNDAFIIGGASIYNYALENKLVDNVYIDFINEDVDDADAFISESSLIKFFNLYDTKNNFVLSDKASAFIIGKSHNDVDSQYIDLVKTIIHQGEDKDTRAGKTRSLFSKSMRFDLKKGFPLLTTKKVYVKGVVHELLWFLKGDTNIKYLVDNNVHIWDDDAYRYYLELVKKDGGEPLSKEEFLNRVNIGDSRYFNNLGGMYYKYGDLNNIYGYQWTKWGGHNQIQEIIDTLNTNPDDRRMILSAWNIEDIPNMALPPCHFSCQFYTRKMTLEERRRVVVERRGEDVGENIELLDEFNIPTRKLSCVWHQRSVDCISGLPFNIASYALLTHMVAQCANMDVDELIFDGGDCHVYENQIDTFIECQMSNFAHKYELPTLRLNTNIKNIFDFKYDDIVVENYESYPAIKYPLNTGLQK